MRSRILLPLTAALALLAGCASTSARPAFEDVRSAVTTRSGHAVRWNQSTAEDAEAERAVARLLAGELTADAAVQIALLSSPALQSELEELAIAQADLVQAGLLRNPTFTLGRTAWESEHIAPNLFATVEQDFLGLLTMPLQKRVAATELEATKLEIGDHVLALAARVREAFFVAQAAEQTLAMRRLVDEASKTAADLARAQHAAGNVSDLALSNELGLSAQTSLDRTRAEGDAAVAREKLNKLLGLWGPRTAWRMAARLPELPEREAPLDALESKALEHRMDVGAARRNVQALGYALDLVKTTRWVGTVNVGVEAGRLRHGERFSFGPSVALEIPLFDQRTAQIAKLEAHARRATRDLEALAIDVRADVRSARARVLTARALVEEYGKVVIPLREGVVRHSQAHYDAMLLGVYQLIQAKQSKLDAYRDFIEALRDYWLARSDLERAVGARLDPAPAAVVRKSAPAAAVAPPSHAH